MTINYLIENKDITELSNFKTQAKARYYFEIHNRQDLDKLSKIHEFAKLNNIKLLFIGGGTNLLFAFDLFDGIIINNCLEGWSYNNENKILESYSNEIISDLAKSLYEDGQTLWKRFIGLPGTVGGAVFGNAGCFGLEVENNFKQAEVLDLDNGKIINLNKKDMQFDYRNSIIKKTGKYFIIKIEFDLSSLVEKYASDVDNIHFREHKQPKGNTCGSFFKNPSKDNSAGKLIEQVGLKGKEIGGVEFSNIHANFLMNNGEAGYKDLLSLINLAQMEVKNKFNIDLIPEVRIITN